MTRKYKIYETMVVAILAVVLLTGGFVKTGVGGETSEKYTVEGMEFWTETVDNEPGNFMVYWGEEKYKWEPKPWQPDETKEVGPIFYARHNKQLADKGYFPFNIPMEKRAQLPAKEFHDIFYPLSPLPLIAGKDGAYFQDLARIETRSPGDKKRYSIEAFEYLRGYRNRTDLPDGEPRWKYMLTVTAPDESSGQGFLQIVYEGDKRDDSFLYLPAVRKVRRLASASKQDYVARTLFRQEDNALCKPMHNYQYIGKEILQDPGPEVPGYGVGGMQPDVNFEGKDHRANAGVGEPCRLMEITPYRDDWWFGKQIKHVGVFSGMFWREQCYDKKGRLIRALNFRSGLWYAPGEEKAKGGVPVPHWDSLAATEYTTGYWHNMYSSDVSILQKGVPVDRIFTEKTLLLEPRKIDWYR